MHIPALLRSYRWYCVTVFIFAVVYFISRLTNLTDLPIFTDEAIYIRWAQIGGNDPEWRFISLTDGKQPLFVWGIMAALRIFSDPLFAGRIVSVAAGFLSMIGIGVLAGTFFKNIKIGCIASLLYLTSPFSLMYDRLALMDSLLATFSIWSLYLFVLTVRHIRLDTALLLGMTIGGAVLTKTSGFISVYLMPFAALLFDFKQKNARHNLMKLFGLFIIAVVVSQLMYAVLRLSPWFYIIAQKDATFVHPVFDPYTGGSLVHYFTIWIQRLLNILPYALGNIRSLVEWMVVYLTPPLIISAVAAFFITKTDLRKKIFLLMYSVVPLIGLGYLGLKFYPRFIFFMAMPLLILAAYAIGVSIEKYRLSGIKKYILIALVIAYPLFVQTKILFSILTAPIPRADVMQYVNDVFSGWGIREVNTKLTQLSKDQEITVFTDGTFGLLPYGIEIYQVENKNIHIIGIYPTPNDYTDDMIKEIKTRPTYYIANQIGEIPPEWNTTLIDRWQKGLSEKKYLRLYRLYEKGVVPINDEEIFREP